MHGNLSLMAVLADALVRKDFLSTLGCPGLRFPQTFHTFDNSDVHLLPNVNLPPSFVLKPTHIPEQCEFFIQAVHRDANHSALKEELVVSAQQWFAEFWAQPKAELAYHLIQPRVIVEELVELPHRAVFELFDGEVLRNSASKLTDAGLQTALCIAAGLPADVRFVRVEMLQDASRTTSVLVGLDFRTSEEAQLLPLLPPNLMNNAPQTDGTTVTTRARRPDEARLNPKSSSARGADCVQAFSLTFLDVPLLSSQHWSNQLECSVQHGNIADKARLADIVTAKNAVSWSDCGLIVPRIIASFNQSSIHTIATADLPSSFVLRATHAPDQILFVQDGRARSGERMDGEVLLRIGQQFLRRDTAAETGELYLRLIEPRVVIEERSLDDSSEEVVDLCVFNQVVLSLTPITAEDRLIGLCVGRQIWPRPFVRVSLLRGPHGRYSLLSLRFLPCGNEGSGGSSNELGKLLFTSVLSTLPDLEHDGVRERTLSACLHLPTELRDPSHSIPLSERHITWEDLPILLNPRHADWGHNLMCRRRFGDMGKMGILGDKATSVSIIRGWSCPELQFIPRYAVFGRNNVSEFRLANFPSSFVLKASHGSSMTWFVEGGLMRSNPQGQEEPVDQDVLIADMHKWLNTLFGRYNWEISYGLLPPRVVVEANLFTMAKAGRFTEYKFHTMGEDSIPSIAVQVQKRGGKSVPFGTVVNPDFYPIYTFSIDKETVAKKPTHWDEMLAVCQCLIRHIGRYTRVDLYDVDGAIYFGELTFGSGHIMPKELFLASFYLSGFWVNGLLTLARGFRHTPPAHWQTHQLYRPVTLARSAWPPEMAHELADEVQHGEGFVVGLLLWIHNELGRHGGYQLTNTSFENALTMGDLPVNQSVLHSIFATYGEYFVQAIDFQHADHLRLNFKLPMFTELTQCLRAHGDVVRLASLVDRSSAANIVSTFECDSLIVPRIIASFDKSSIHTIATADLPSSFVLRATHAPEETLFVQDGRVRSGERIDGAALLRIGQQFLRRDTAAETGELYLRLIEPRVVIEEFPDEDMNGVVGVSTFDGVVGPLHLHVISGSVGGDTIKDKLVDVAGCIGRKIRPLPFVRVLLGIGARSGSLWLVRLAFWGFEEMGERNKTGTFHNAAWLSAATFANHRSYISPFNDVP